MLQKFLENNTQQHIFPPAVTDTAAVAVTDLTRRYRIGGNWKSALDGVTLRLEKGQIVGLIGPSGSGKSTLLRHITGLTLAENHSSRVEVLGHMVQQSGRAAPDLRRVRRDIGFIFQQFNLIDRLPLLTNVLIENLPQEINHNGDAVLLNIKTEREGYDLRAIPRWSSNLDGNKRMGFLVYHMSRSWISYLKSIG